MSPPVTPPGLVSGPPSPAFGGGIWASCYEHFVPSDSARIDANRLAIACGPSTGLARFERTSGTVDEARRPVVFRWEGRKRDCFRVFAAAAAPVEDLEVEIVERRGGRQTLSNRSDRWVVAPEEGPFCAAEDGFFEARFGTHAGRGEFAAFVYRAEGMVPKKPRTHAAP